MGSEVPPFTYFDRTMKTHIITYLCIITCFCTKLSAFTISGTIHDQEATVSSIHLYKWHNTFYQELIADIPVYNGTFSYSNNDLVEVDTYMIKNPLNSQFLLFILDADITIQINSFDLFYEAQVFGSPLTKKLLEFNKMVLDSLYNPIRKLDTLIQNTSEFTPRYILDDLKQERERRIKVARETTIPLCLNYVKNNPNSFISLFILTKYGVEPQREDYRVYFNLLSESLKGHSRARIFISEI